MSLASASAVYITQTKYCRGIQYKVLTMKIYTKLQSLQVLFAIAISFQILPRVKDRKSVV